MGDTLSSLLSHVRAAIDRLPRAVTALAMFIAVAFLTRALFLRDDILGPDESSYFIAAGEMLQHRLLYTDVADNKPPLIYFYYACAQLLGADDLFGVRLLTTLVTVPLTALAASAFYQHDRRGVVAGLLFLVYSAAYDASEMLSVNCEIVMLLPLGWALVMVREPSRSSNPRAVLYAGLLLGIATLVKYQAIFWLPAIGLSLVLARRGSGRLRQAATLGTLAAGLAVAIAITCGVFWLAGGMEGFFYWNVTQSFEYLVNPTTPSEALGRAARRFGPFLVVTAPLWLGWRRSAGEGAYQTRLLTWIIASTLVACALGFRFFPHYFIQLYWPLAVAAAPYIERVTRAPRERVGTVVAAYSLAALLAFTAFNAFSYLRAPQDSNAVSQRVASRLKADACYGDKATLFVWGLNPVFYYHARLPVASRQFFPAFPLVRYYAGNPTATAAARLDTPRIPEQGDRHWRWLLADLSAHPPTYIVDTAPAGLTVWRYFPLEDYPALWRIVRTSYERLDTVNGVEVYRRVSCG